MKVRDLMTPAPESVTPETSVAAASELLRTYDLSLLPVVADAASKRLVGVITDRDIVERCIAAGHGGECVVRDHMTCHGLQTVRAEDEVGVVEMRIELGRVRRLPVVDDRGHVVGVVTRTDLLAQR